nr:hypothetical protein [Singulisphaera acidiphila]
MAALASPIPHTSIHEKPGIASPVIGTSMKAIIEVMATWTRCDAPTVQGPGESANQDNLGSDGDRTEERQDFAPAQPNLSSIWTR